MGKRLSEQEKTERAKRNHDVFEQAQQRVDAYGKAMSEGERIKTARTDKGLTQQDLADCLGISRDSLIEYEKSGDLKFPTRVFLAMCEVLDCSPQYLMGIDDCYHRETTDIHRLTGLSELAIENLLCRRVGAIQWGYSLSTEDHLVLSDFISYLITHIDEHLLISYVESYAYYEIGRMIIEDAIENGHEDDVRYPKSEISRDTKFHENSAFRIKTELSDKFKFMLEDWGDGRKDFDVVRYLELMNQSK